MPVTETSAACTDQLEIDRSSGARQPLPLRRSKRRLGQIALLVACSVPVAACDLADLLEEVSPTPTTQPAPPTTAPAPPTTAPAPPTTATAPPTTAPAPPTTAPTVPISLPTGTAALNPAEVLSLAELNNQRTTDGRTQVKASADLSAYARAWGEEMSKTGFRHSSRESLRGLLTGNRTGYGENIVWISDATLTPQQVAARFQELWRNSQGHYRNQINPGWTEVGVGMFLNDGGWWGVHVFSNGS